eukprot:CAMPEP_0114426930 /NCGR_PEP_ID=MMETSP0103-20121206/8068_1 /TAXON_ID=37642 ORGANISM="Paraphysomonas imperforata, Strain PA2" /NCGR_SAMPLE_ID=MMETSP0103 /ASSEMBLY_ACC=CAM_ASM_000201 /LENGTH=1034 /DNA_ID=CAMNT_0001595939 /DNA_START=159 /DNA_END=3263 /DNA_ORIENTATION=-
MFYSLVAIISCFIAVEAATTGVGGVTTTTDISAYGYMMAIADSSITTSAQSTGHVGVTYFDYRTNDWTGREDILLNPFTINTVTDKVLFGDDDTSILANNGFGHAVECVNDETIAISACSKNYNSGRVYLYKGRNSHWTAQQILNSYHTGPSETYSTSGDTFFGEALDSSEGVLAVGCRNCNSTTKGYRQSGEVYIFRPEKEKNSVLWTNTQVLTGKDIYFLGGHLSMHENVIVVSGSSKEDFTLNTIQTTPILASIFLAEDYQEHHGPKSEFKYQHNIVTRDPVYQRISDVAVYDMTVALGTYDTVRNTNNVYVFYPSTKKYRLESKDPKGKPRPVSWSLVQVLANPDPVADFNYQLPTDLTLWNDEIFMRAKTSGGDFRLSTNRSSRADSFNPFYAKNSVPTKSLNHQMTVSDYLWFQDGLAAGRVLNAPVDIAPSGYSCLRIWVEDAFDDGWDVAELIVESPTGIKRSYKTECDSTNPQVHRYCPIFNDEPESKGIHKMYVVNGKEAKFNWEILWRVYNEASAKWDVGDIHTEMDFEWQYHDRKFLTTRMHKPRENVTCTVCPANAEEWEAHHKTPSKPKAKGLQNLRALSHRSETAAPTVSRAPTIAMDFSKDWNVVELINDVGGGITDSWFEPDGRGTDFYISDTEGKKIVYSGTACGVGTTAVGCYVKLDDGDYTLRVTGATDQHSLQRRWKFCQGLNYQNSQTELYFTIVDGVCYPVMTRHQTLVCDNIIKITNLHVEIALSGDFSGLMGRTAGLTWSQLQPISMATSSALQQIFGFEAVSSSIVGVEQASSTSIVVVVNVGFKKFDQNLDSTLKALELGGGATYRTVIRNTVLSAPASASYDSSILEALSDVTVHDISIADETVDYSSEDESNYHKVINFIPESSDFKSPSNAWIIESEHVVAIAGYLITIATVFVAIGFIYSSIKRRIDPQAVDQSPIKPSAARRNLHLVDSSSSSDDDDDDANSIDLERSIPSSIRKVSIEKKNSLSSKKMSKKSKSNQDLKLKKLLENEDAVYRKGSRQSSVS